MPPGRRARVREDTTPGKVLALALLANAPILAAFILVPLATGGDMAAARRYAPVVVWATPLLAVLSVGTFLRAPPERKAHRASRIGVVLAGAALLLWAFVLVSVARAG